MSLGEHLEELRRRLLLGIVGVLPIFILGLVFGKQILMVIIRPLEMALTEQHVWAGAMQVTSVLEYFMNYLKIAALLAVVVGAPWLIYQLWRFVAPGLYSSEKRFFRLLAPMSIVLSVSGVVFMYYVMLPFVLLFFVHFNNAALSRPPSPVVQLPDGVSLPSVPRLAGDPPNPRSGDMWLNTDRGALRLAMPPTKDAGPDAAPLVLSLPLQNDSFIVQQYKVNEYVNLVLGFALAFALTFQTPVVVLLLGWAGLINPKMMAGKRKYAILVCAIIAAVVTPPDAISMASLGIPMYLLYEFGLLLLRIMPAERVARGSILRRAAPVGSSPDGLDSPPVEP